MLTPYPGTPMFKQLEPLLTETDWEKFDGYTPTFAHPEPDGPRAAVPARRGIQALLHAAVVPRELPEDPEPGVRDWVSRMDRRVNDRHTREEIADISRPVAC